MSLPKIVILFSGEGSNLINIIKKSHRIDLEVIAAITNRPQAKGIERAKALGVHVDLIDHTTFTSREAFDAALLKQIEHYQPHLVIMAGFMRILTPTITDHIRAINVHPSLLPLFKGGNAIVESFKSDEKQGGITVHWVSSELDAGEIIAQASFDKDEKDDLESFTQKIRTLEHQLLPQTIVNILRS